MCTNHFRKIKINQHSQQTGIKEYFLQNWSFLLLKINQLIVQMGKKNRNRNPMFPGFFKIAQQDGDSYVRNPARSADWFIMRVYKYGRDRILSLSRDYLLSDSGLDHNLALRSNIRPFLVSPPPAPTSSSSFVCIILCPHETLTFSCFFTASFNKGILNQMWLKYGGGKKPTWEEKVKNKHQTWRTLVALPKR